MKYCLFIDKNLLCEYLSGNLFSLNWKKLYFNILTDSTICRMPSVYNWRADCITLLCQTEGYFIFSFSKLLQFLHGTFSSLKEHCPTFFPLICAKQIEREGSSRRPHIHRALQEFPVRTMHKEPCLQRPWPNDSDCSWFPFFFNAKHFKTFTSEHTDN